VTVGICAGNAPGGAGRAGDGDGRKERGRRSHLEERGSRALQARKTRQAAVTRRLRRSRRLRPGGTRIIRLGYCSSRTAPPPRQPNFIPAPPGRVLSEGTADHQRRARRAGPGRHRPANRSGVSGAPAGVPRTRGNACRGNPAPKGPVGPSAPGRATDSASARSSGRPRARMGRSSSILFHLQQSTVTTNGWRAASCSAQRARWTSS
jgi:hypothetical protein